MRIIIGLDSGLLCRLFMANWAEVIFLWQDYCISGFGILGNSR